MYVYGSHHPDYIYVTADEGFLASATDHGAGTRFNYGPLRKHGNQLFLVPNIKRGTLNYEPVANVYQIVDWKGIRYLVPNEGLRKFAWMLHSRTGYGLVGYPSKSTGEANEYAANIPAKLLEIVNGTPIEGKVRRITKPTPEKGYEDSVHGIEVEINRGSSDGGIRENLTPGVFVKRRGPKR